MLTKEEFVYWGVAIRHCNLQPTEHKKHNWPNVMMCQLRGLWWMTVIKRGKFHDESNRKTSTDRSAVQVSALHRFIKAEEQSLSDCNISGDDWWVMELILSFKKHQSSNVLTWKSFDIFAKKEMTPYAVQKDCDAISKSSLSEKVAIAQESSSLDLALARVCNVQLARSFSEFFFAGTGCTLVNICFR